MSVRGVEYAGRNHPRLARWLVFLGAALCLAVPAYPHAAEHCISVVYPEVGEPYRSVLEEIIRGIRKGTRWAVRPSLLPEGGARDTGAPSAAPACAAAIGLGPRGSLAVAELAGKVAVVSGGTLVEPLADNAPLPGISLMPSPLKLFVRLKYFAPWVKKVTVVYNPENTGALVRMAARAAPGLGLDLSALEAHDPREAVTLYREVLEESDARSTALWLLQDARTVDRDAVLPLVLRRAWRRKLVVFSSQPDFVKNGVLFSVYPRNERLGRRLGALAQKCALEACPARIAPLQDVYTAVNIRTAARLGIHIDPQFDRFTDLVFPRR